MNTTTVGKIVCNILSHIADESSREVTKWSIEVTSEGHDKLSNIWAMSQTGHRNQQF